MNKPKILFVCSRNKWRSPTAEKIYLKNDNILVRSAGLSAKARHQINQSDILWADLIVFMENWHKSKLTAQYRGAVRFPSMEVLGIADEFNYMDEELIEILVPQMNYLLKQYFDIEPVASPDAASPRR